MGKSSIFVVLHPKYSILPRNVSFYTGNSILPILDGHILLMRSITTKTEAHTRMKRQSYSMTCSCSYFSPRLAWAKPFKLVIFGLQKVSKMLPKTPKNIVPILGCFFDAFWCQNDPQKRPQNPQNLDKTAFGAPIFSPTQHKVIPKSIWAPK